MMFLTIGITILFLLLAIIYITKEDTGSMIGPFVFGGVLMIAMSIVLGREFQTLEGTHSTKPIKPITIVECINGKCDTTYIYRTKE